MARIACVVVPGLPHHVTQRGNRREPVFFGAEDYRFYCRLIANAARRAGAEIWAYCLMPNHVHLIVTPADEDGLRRTFGEAHRRYTGAINARFRWTGHLFQGRFGAVVMERAAPAGGGALHRAQPGGGGAGKPCRGLAVVERPRPSCKTAQRPARPCTRPARASDDGRGVRFQTTYRLVRSSHSSC